MTQNDTGAAPTHHGEDSQTTGITTAKRSGDGYPDGESASQTSTSD